MSSKQQNLDARVRDTITNLSDDDLLKVMQAPRRDHTPYAVEVAQEELSKRGGKEAIRQRRAKRFSERVSNSPEAMSKTIKSIHETGFIWYFILFKRAKAFWLWIFISLSIIGLFASLIVHLSTSLQFQNPLQNFTWWLQVSLVVVSLAALLFQYQGSSGNNEKNEGGTLRDCPAWMKYTIHGIAYYASARLIIYGLLNNEIENVGEFIKVLMEVLAIGVEIEIPNENIQLQSAIWMVFHYAAFVFIFSSMRSDRVHRRCPNGHTVERLEKDCRKCGLRIADSLTGHREGSRKRISRK